MTMMMNTEDPLIYNIAETTIILSVVLDSWWLTIHLDYAR